MTIKKEAQLTLNDWLVRLPVRALVKSLQGAALLPVQALHRPVHARLRRALHVSHRHCPHSAAHKPQLHATVTAFRPHHSRRAVTFAFKGGRDLVPYLQRHRVVQVCRHFRAAALPLPPRAVPCAEARQGLPHPNAFCWELRYTTIMDDVHAGLERVLEAARRRLAVVICSEERQRAKG